MNILVTGGAGYLGSRIVEDLLNMRYWSSQYREPLDSIFVIDNLMYEKHYLNKHVTFYNVDVTDRVGMNSLFSAHHFDVVIHTAGIVGDYACRIHNKLSEKVNVESLKIIREDFDGYVIFPSSCSVYGSNNEIVDETSSLNPLSLYAEQKIRAEEILNGSDCLILRLGTLHGTSGRVRNDIVVNTLTLKALKHRKLTVYGGEQWRPLVHLADVSSAIMYAMYRHKFNGIYNCSHENRTILDIAKEIQANINSPEVEIVTEDIPYEDFRNYRVKNDKLLGDFGYIFQRGISDTVKELQEMVLDGRIKNLSEVTYSNVGRLEFTI